MPIFEQSTSCSCQPRDRFVLSGSDLSAVDNLVTELSNSCSSTEDDGFLMQLPVYAHELPRDVRRALQMFKAYESGVGCLTISGFPINSNVIGPTPDHWAVASGSPRTIREQIYLLLLSVLLGDVIGWATQQNGHVVHDVLPIRGHEYEQLGTGCSEVLWWHNEDAFHPLRGDYIGLLCLRNPDHVPTTFASIEGITLENSDLDLLFEPHFAIRPDNSHLAKNNFGEGVNMASSFEAISRMASAPEKLAVLFGDRQCPYIRVDPYFMDQNEIANPAARAALERLIHAIDSRLGDIILEPGDVLFVDNYRAVHGRRAFKARFEGNDRWLKRTNIARDLRKSRGQRRSSISHVLT